MEKIGIRMHDLGPLTPEALAGHLAEVGANCGQLAIPKSIPGITGYADVDDALLARLRTAFAGAGIEVSVLGCYIEPSLAEEAERRAQLATFGQGIRCAAALGAGCIGTETTRFSGTGEEWEKAFARLCRSVEWMLATAQKQNVTVAIEPVGEHVLNTPAATARLLETFHSSGLRIIFDALNLLHPSMLGRQEAYWRECLDAFGHAVAACHIKDATPAPGGGWQECALGEGVLSYAPIAAWLRGHSLRPPLLREGFLPQRAATEMGYIRRAFFSS